MEPRPIDTKCIAKLFEATGNKWSAEVVRLANALRDPSDGSEPICYERACKAPHYGYVSTTTTGVNARGRHNLGRKLTKQQRARVARPLPSLR